MLAYLFWHAPSADVEPRDYETALLAFQADLVRTPPSGFASCAAYRISKIPWLNNRKGYEDWYFVQSSADLDPLNEAAVQPARWDVHARVASKMQFGQGGLYAHLYGAEQPREGTHSVWLTRPRGIRYELPLRSAIDASPGFLSCWRRQMVLGPGDEFVIIGTSQLNMSCPQGWQARIVERTILDSD